MKKTVDKLIKESFIADAHLDLAFDIVRQREYGRKKVLENDYLEDLQNGGVNCIISSIYIDNQFVPEMALRRALGQVETLLQDITECSNYFQFCTNKKQILDAHSKNKIAVMLSFEGVEPIYNDLNLFDLFYRLGVRGVGLCWSRRNYAADGSSFVNVKSGKKGGLTSFGFELLEAAHKENVYIDLSHINDEGFEDVLNFYDGPIMVSHTNSRTLNPTMRNISENQIKEISKREGFIGINSMNFTVSNGTSPENIKGYCDHIDNIVAIGGIDCVGFGFDFNDIILKYIPEQQLLNLPRKPFDCIKGYKEIPLIIKELLDRDYKEDDIKKILGSNFLDFLERTA